MSLDTISFIASIHQHNSYYVLIRIPPTSPNLVTRSQISSYKFLHQSLAFSGDTALINACLQRHSGVL